MINSSNKNNECENILYNNILLLSRNKLFYTKFNLSDTFQNRIILIFIHVSFLFIKVKREKEKGKYQAFYQKIFDIIFRNIELNMREIGYGDVSINKNMKKYLNYFYDIINNINIWDDIDEKQKELILNKFINNPKNISFFTNYFDKLCSFYKKKPRLSQN